MPELPDIETYIEALDRRILGQTLTDVRLRSSVLLRTVQPPIRDAAERKVVGLHRVGKRIAIGLDGDSGWCCT